MPLETMQHAMTRLEAAGYTGSFRAERGHLRCIACGCRVEPEAVTIDEVVRFEGASDPDEQAALFAISCGECAMKGTYAVVFGPAMPAEDGEVVRRLPFS